MRIILCHYSTQEKYGSWQTQRGSVTHPAPAARPSALQCRDDPAGFTGDPGAAVWQGGMSMRGGRAARTVHLSNVTQVTRPQGSALRAGRAGRTRARAHRADRADASIAGRDLRAQLGVVKSPAAGLSSHGHAGAGVIVANMVEAALAGGLTDYRRRQDYRLASGADGSSVFAPVEHCSSARVHRVDRAATCPSGESARLGWAPREFR